MYSKISLQVRIILTGIWWAALVLVGYWCATGIRAVYDLVTEAAPNDVVASMVISSVSIPFLLIISIAFLIILCIIWVV